MDTYKQECIAKAMKLIEAAQVEINDIDGCYHIFEDLGRIIVDLGRV